MNQNDLINICSSSNVQNSFSENLKDMNEPNIFLIFYKSLKSDEVNWAMGKSCDIVGCTGDDSLSRAISMSKFPIYFIRDIKTGFADKFKCYLMNNGIGQLLPLMFEFISIFGNKKINYNDNYYKNENVNNELDKFRNIIVKDIKENHNLGKVIQFKVDQMMS